MGTSRVSRDAGEEPELEDELATDPNGCGPTLTPELRLEASPNDVARPLPQETPVIHVGERDGDRCPEPAQEPGIRVRPPGPRRAPPVLKTPASSPWWRRFLGQLRGRRGRASPGAASAPHASSRPTFEPTEADLEPLSASPFEPPPWSTAEAPPTGDPGGTRDRLLRRLYELRTEAPSRDDWRFVDRLIHSCSIPRLDFPLFPDGALRLDRLLRTGEPSQREIIQIVRQEPGLVQRVWQEGKSSTYGDRRTLSLDEAIVRVGRRRLWEIAMSASLNARLFRVRGYQSDANHLRSISVVAADVSVVFRTSDDVFLPSLLHGLGKLVVYRCAAQAAPTQATTPAFAISVADRLYPSIGVLVAEAWDLGPAVAAGIGFATAPERAPPPYRGVATATCACMVAAHEAWADTQRRSFDGFRALRALGYPPATVHKGLDAADAAWRKDPAPHAE